MSEAAAPEAPAAPAPSPLPGAETAATPSVAGGAELGAEIPGRAKAIAIAREAMEARNKDSMGQAQRQAEEHAIKARDKAAREKAPPAERGEDGKFRSALSPADAEQQTKAPAAKVEPKKEAAPAADDDASELEKLEQEWRKVRSSKKAAKTERREASAWREEQARATAEKAADDLLRRDNPAAWLEKHAFDFREVAKQAVAKVEPTPAEKAAQAALEKADRLEKELNDRKAREEAAGVEERRVKALAQLNGEGAEAWKTSAAEYPTLAEHYEAADIVDTLTQLRIDYFREHQREVPIATALEHMEKLAQREKARFTKAKASERTERATVSTKVEKPRAVVGPITNKDAAISATPPQGLSPEERRSRSVAMAAQGWRR